MGTWTVTPTSGNVTRPHNNRPWYQRGAAVFAMYNYVLATGLIVAILCEALSPLSLITVVVLLIGALVAVAWDSR